jgi:hypothetical protein
MCWEIIGICRIATIRYRGAAGQFPFSMLAKGSKDEAPLVRRAIFSGFINVESYVR